MHRVRVHQRFNPILPLPLRFGTRSALGVRAVTLQVVIRPVPIPNSRYAFFRACIGDVLWLGTGKKSWGLFWRGEYSR
jgi:hypothetical protein